LVEKSWLLDGSVPQGADMKRKNHAPKPTCSTMSAPRQQPLELVDFWGCNANAVRRQVWTALLVYVLLRSSAYLSQWPHSFTRLFTPVRPALWEKWELRTLLESYGRAGGRLRFLGTPEQGYLPGLG
jgi:hypothetical protein